MSAVGVANFKPDHLRKLVAETDVVPAVNQIELHPNFQQPDQVALHRELGIVTQAWSPIGGVYGWAGENGAGSMCATVGSGSSPRRSEAAIFAAAGAVWIPNPPCPALRAISEIGT